MPQRVNYYAAAPDGMKAMMQLEKYLHGASIEHSLLHLVKLRASQINGCAYCIDMHWKDARALGESEQRLYGLDAWRESPGYYTPREMAAFAWTEALTKITDGHASDAVFEQVRPHFNDKELSDLSLVIATINAWNRLAIGFRSEPGHYKPGIFKMT